MVSTWYFYWLFVEGLIHCMYPFTYIRRLLSTCETTSCMTWRLLVSRMRFKITRKGSRHYLAPGYRSPCPRGIPRFEKVLISWDLCISTPICPAYSSNTRCYLIDNSTNYLYVTQFTTYSSTTYTYPNTYIPTNRTQLQRCFPFSFAHPNGSPRLGLTHSSETQGMHTTPRVQSLESITLDSLLAGSVVMLKVVESFVS